MSTTVSYGFLKGTLLSTLPTKLKKSAVGLSPTTSMARSVLFNVIQNNKNFLNIDISKSKILDLCCGSGIVGIEFLSLGAKEVFFMDCNIDVLHLLNDNLYKMDLADKARVMMQKAPIKSYKSFFDIIFFDPPYDERELVKQQMKCFVENQTLSEDGFVILEADRSFKDINFEGFNLVLEREVSSKTKLLFFKYE